MRVPGLGRFVPELVPGPLHGKRVYDGEMGLTVMQIALRSALIAAYMVYIHAARAVLFRDGVREKSHYCIGVYLESYRERGLLEDEWVLQFDHMRGMRQNDQYSRDARPTIQEVRQAVADAGEFIERLERLVNGACS